MSTETTTIPAVLPTTVTKGTKISFKNRNGVVIKGVVKRISADEKIVINGEDGARYMRDTDEVIIIGAPHESLDALTLPVKQKAVKLPISEKIKDVDVNQRFQYLSQLVRMVIAGTQVSLIITGEGGLGKTYTTKKEVLRKRLTDGEDYVHIKGFSTPRGLYRTLFENNGKLIIFDDCDEVLEDKIATGLLKGALDSYDERTISWITKSADESLPDSFDFTGRVIFITNLDKEDVPQALLSRSFNIDLSMTRQEKVERMQWIIDNAKDFMPGHSAKIKQECLDIIKQYAEEVRELSLRSLEKVIKLKAGEKDQLDLNDEDYIAMDWKDLAKFMLLS
jgi:hypothetical protein